MNKKIASEIAIGVIILFAIIVGGIFWLQNRNQVPVETTASVISQPTARPSCEELSPSQEQIDATVAEAIKGINNPWGNVSDFQLLINRIETKLGCTLEKDSGIFNMQPKPSQQETQSSQPADETANWKLISGNAADNCSGLVYEGSATVKGWYVFAAGYVEKEWMLQIADEDINKFPEVYLSGTKNVVPNMNRGLKLIDASLELQKELKSATKDNPKEITLKGYYLYCEGAPVVSIAPARESFKQYMK